MRDCSNAEMRDRLPELMHNQLTGEALASVRAHVADCVDCRAELALLEQLRLSVVAPRLDVSRMVSSLPRYRAVPAWRRATSSTWMRVAAAVVLLVGAYAGVTRSTPDQPSRTGASRQQAATQELAIGDSFHDLSDSDLAAMIDEIGTLEAVTPEAIEEPLLPLGDAAARSGGGA